MVVVAAARAGCSVVVALASFVCGIVRLRTKRKEERNKGRDRGHLGISSVSRELLRFFIVQCP